jgi:hypothetical protein
MRPAPLLSLALALAPFAARTPAAAQQVVEVGRAFPQLVSPGEAADQLRMATGRVVVAILYRTQCPRSAGMLPGFVKLAELHAQSDVRFVAVAMRSVPEEVPDFLRNGGATFPPLVMRKPRPGELAEAFGPFGFSFPSGWEYPLVAVLSRDGRVVRQWTAATNLPAIDAVVRASL